MESFKPLCAIQDGISEQLYKCFGEQYEIYPEEVKQGLKKPCFFIKLIKPSFTKERDEIYYAENLYCVHFFPENTKEPKAECYATLDRLYMALELIEINGNPVRGIGMNGEIHDEILQFHVNYNVFVRRVNDPIMMETLEIIDFRTKG